MTASVHPPSRWPRSAWHELWHQPANHVAALDGLRSLAVLLVICDHWVAEWHTVAGLPKPRIASLPVFHWGWTGVDLFFVLSGFLIGKQLWGQLLRTGTIGVSEFILRRGLRIWPLYYATMAFLALVGAAKAPSWSDWVMLSNYVPSRYARSWSLSTEEQFYLFIPLFLLLCARWLKRPHLPAGIMALLVAVSIARGVTWLDLSGRGIDPARVSVLMYSAFHLHCEALLIGLLIAWVTIERREWVAPAQAGGVAWRSLAACVLLAGTGIALRTINREVFAYLALACVYGALLCVALTDRSMLTAALRWPIWNVIARCSFGMYLNHLILREPTDTILGVVTTAFGSESTLGFLVGLFLAVLASAATAALTFVLIEQPGLALRDRWLAQRKARATAPASPRVAA